MASVRVLILRAAGTNCDLETEHAWRLAGAEPSRVHVRRVIEQPGLLREYQIVTIPGGFSYGDDIAAGRIFAAQIQQRLLDGLRSFVDDGRLLLGICNGFQVLVTCGMLPFGPAATGAPRVCSVTANDPPGFQDRWVTMRAVDSPCVFLAGGRTYEFPIAHGEGRVVFADESVRRRVLAGRHAALLYCPPADAGSGDLPANPNGSTDDIAGLCDATGRIFGLMPHPDRFVDWTQHPCWTSLPKRAEGDGLDLFRRGVAHFR